MKPIIPVMRTALEQIQELHKPELWVDGLSFHCVECSGTGDTMPTLSPCPTRKLADEALIDRMARTNQGENK